MLALAAKQPSLMAALDGGVVDDAGRHPLKGEGNKPTGQFSRILRENAYRALSSDATTALKGASRHCRLVKATQLADLLFQRRERLRGSQLTWRGNPLRVISGSTTRILGTLLIFAGMHTSAAPTLSVHPDTKDGPSEG